MKPLFGAVLGEPLDGKAFYLEHEALKVLESYVATKLQPPPSQQQKEWVLDAHLCDALYKGDGNAPQPLPTALSAKEVRKRFLNRLERWTRVTGGLLEKPIQTKGLPPRVVVTTEQRRGHHVTLVSELSSYSLDPYSAARELQVLCGATANVEEVALKSSNQPKRNVSVQGLWDRSVEEWLESRHGLPSECVDNRAAGKSGQSQKREKKATNVRRA